MRSYLILSLVALASAAAIERQTALSPYDPTHIPSDCVSTMCQNLDGTGESLWCMYLNTVGHAGMTFRKLFMECQPEWK